MGKHSEAFWEEFWESSTQAVEQKLKQAGSARVVRIRPSQHPQLHQHIEALAQQFGLDYTPKVIVTEALPFGPIWLHKKPNAFANPALKVIMVSENMLHMTGSDLQRPMADKLETIMAHEMSHLKHDRLSSVATFLSPYLAPAIAVTGLYLYDRAHKRALEKQAATGHAADTEMLMQALHQEADEELKRLGKEQPKSDEWQAEPASKKAIINTARYATAAAIGAAVGLAAARHASLTREFRADRLAVEMTGKPEAFKEALLQLSNEFRQTAIHRPPPETLRDYVKEAFHKLMSKTIHAHPTLPERLSYIDKVAAERNLGAGFMHGPA